MGSDSSQVLTEFPWYPQEHILTLYPDLLNYKTEVAGGGGWELIPLQRQVHASRLKNLCLDMNLGESPRITGG